MTNLEAIRNENDESHQISYSTSHRKPVDSQHNFNSLSEEVISSDIDPYLSQIPYIQDGADNISKLEEDNNPTLQL